MKKILLILATILIFLSCWLPPSEEEKKEIVEKKLTEQKKVLVTRFKEDALEKLKKFDKNNTREKESTLTWFLCFNETLNHPTSNLSVIAKNCKHEDKDKVVYFKIKWNSLFKVVDITEEEIMVLKTKLEKETILTYLSNNYTSVFKNILDKKNCKAKKLVKKDFLNNSPYAEVYIIEPFWFYKTETAKQLKKDPNSIICEWFYPDMKKFFIYESKHPKYIIEVLRKDILMDLDSITFDSPEVKQ